MTMRQILLLLLVFISAPTLARVRAPKIELSASVVSKLDHVMGKADDLRRAMVEQRDPLVITKARELTLVLGEAIRVYDPDSQNKKHLDLILKDARKALETALTAKGEERKATFQHAFRQIVLIGQTYKINEKVKFYFCRNDRSVWVQKDGKPQNPISPESYRNCGVQVQ